MHLVILVADRDVFARHEGVRTEAIARFVVLIARRAVVEHPTGMLLASRAVDELSNLLFIAPESAYPAVVAVLAPKLRIDVAFGVKWGNELVSVPRRTRRELLRAGEVEPDALEHMRQLGHGSLLDRTFFEHCMSHASLLDAAAAVLTWLNVSGECPRHAVADAAKEILSA